MQRFLVFFNKLHDLDALISSTAFSIVFPFRSCPVSDHCIDFCFYRSVSITDIFDAILELTVAFIESFIFVSCIEEISLVSFDSLFILFIVIFIVVFCIQSRR